MKRLKAEHGYSNEFEQTPDSIEDGRRAWWCPSCGAVRDRYHSTRRYAFCSNCEHRDAVLIEMEPVGPGKDKIV